MLKVGSDDKVALTGNAGQHGVEDGLVLTAVTEPKRRFLSRL